MKTRDEQLIRATLDMAATEAEECGTCAVCGDGFAAAEGIRAIDPAEVLAKVEWKGPGEKPHRYSPDYMAQGDCRICGHTREAHQPAPNAVARLVKAARQRDGGSHDEDCKIGRESNPFCNCGHDELMSALAAMEVRDDRLR